MMIDKCIAWYGLLVVGVVGFSISYCAVKSRCHEIRSTNKTLAALAVYGGCMFAVLGAVNSLIWCIKVLSK
jgi:prolipoprotein diacylglyceryltransferase